MISLPQVYANVHKESLLLRFCYVSTERSRRRGSFRRLEADEVSTSAGANSSTIAASAVGSIVGVAALGLGESYAMLYIFYY